MLQLKPPAPEKAIAPLSFHNFELLGIRAALVKLGVSCPVVLQSTRVREDCITQDGFWAPTTADWEKGIYKSRGNHCKLHSQISQANIWKRFALCPPIYRRSTTSAQQTGGIDHLELAVCKLLLLHTSLAFSTILHNAKDKGRIYYFVAFFLFFQFENLVTWRGNTAYWSTEQNPDCLGLIPSSVVYQLCDPNLSVTSASSSVRWRWRHLRRVLWGLMS